MPHTQPHFQIYHSFLKSVRQTGTYHRKIPNAVTIIYLSTSSAQLLSSSITVSRFSPPRVGIIIEHMQATLIQPFTLIINKFQVLNTLLGNPISRFQTCILITVTLFRIESQQDKSKVNCSLYKRIQRRIMIL
jgi:hypothetical protein